MILMLTVCLGGCAAADRTDFPVDDPYSGQHYLWNRSQFAILEVRVQPSDLYEDSSNLLDSPLEPEVGTLVEIPYGFHLTTIREKVTGGDLWALTTDTPLTLDGGLHVILIFDDGFRTMTPEEASQLTGYIGPGSQEDDVSDVLDHVDATP